jgi:hypothetical protein
MDVVRARSDAIKTSYSRIQEIEDLLIAHVSGLELADIERFQGIPTLAFISSNGSHHFTQRGDVDESEIGWALNFVVGCIILW